MKKFLINLALVAGAASAALAQGDPAAQRQLDNIRHGRPNGDAIQVLYVVNGVTLPAGSIETADLADSSITSAKILANTISNADLAANCVSSANIVNGGVSNADYAASSISGTNVIDGTIVTADLVDSLITSAKILNGAISNADISASCISGTNVIDGTIVDADLASGIDAAKLTTGNLPVARLTNAWEKGNATLDIRTGSCTNGETISFTPAFGSTPFVVGNYVGDLAAAETNAYGDIGGSLRVKVIGASSFVLAPPDDATYHTNRINFIAIFSVN